MTVGAFHLMGVASIERFIPGKLGSIEPSLSDIEWRLEVAHRLFRSDALEGGVVEVSL